MKSVGYCYVFLLFLTASLSAADVTGRWNSEFDTQIGHLKYTYDFKADGDKLTGKAVRTQGEQITITEIKDGKLAGNDISFIETIQFQGRDIRIEYQGKIEGDEIKFTRKVGDIATTESVARREKNAGPVAPITGRWQAEFDTQVGKQKYVYNFKVDGNKLTGRATGDIGGEISDTEIQNGKVNGADISFVEMVKFQGADIHVAYTGTIKGDEIKFIRQVADVATEEMSAKRVKDSDVK